MLLCVKCHDDLTTAFEFRRNARNANQFYFEQYRQEHQEKPVQPSQEPDDQDTVVIIDSDSDVSESLLTAVSQTKSSPKLLDLLDVITIDDDDNLQVKTLFCENCNFLTCDDDILENHISLRHSIIIKTNDPTVKHHALESPEKSTHQRKSKRVKISIKMPKLDSNKSRTNITKVCPICKVELLCGHLKRHIEGVHKKIKRFFCDFCDYSCYQKNQIKDHLLDRKTQNIKTGCRKGRNNSSKKN